jgi:hypothetical protein
LLDGNSIGGEEAEKTLDLYVAELNSYSESHRSDRGRRRRGPTVAERAELRQGDEGVGTSLPLNSAVDDQVNTFLDNFSNRAANRDPDSDPDSDGEPRKRQKLRESELPWSNDTAQRDPICEKTCNLLKLFEVDISKCKSSVRRALNAPPGFPTSQWDRIFRGEAVDLNHVFSSNFTCTVDEERTTRVGDAKISLGVVEAKRKVELRSDWASAWHLYTRAMRVAFPHRLDELQSYADYIEGIFDSKDESKHHTIISFDIAVRNFVGGGQTVLLTDTSKFTCFYNSIVMSDGSNFQSHGGSGKRPGNKRSTAAGTRPTVCNRFNATVGCPNSDTDCKYQHVCKKCGKLGHGQLKCTA